MRSASTPEVFWHGKSRFVIEGNTVVQYAACTDDTDGVRQPAVAADGTACHAANNTLSACEVGSSSCRARVAKSSNIFRIKPAGMYITAERHCWSDFSDFDASLCKPAGTAGAYDPGTSSGFTMNAYVNEVSPFCLPQYPVCGHGA